jgi:hypothetical protein
MGVRGQIAGALAALACVLIPLAGCGGDSSDPVATAAAASPAAAHTGPEPTFTYRGDRRCEITYQDGGNGSMSWTAIVTVAGELITHASDKSGDINRRDVQVSVGSNTFSAAVPLSQVDDIGGVLYVGSKSYGCSVAPQG